MQSGSSDKSTLTVTGRRRGGPEKDSKESETGGLSRSGSLGSLTPTLSSDRIRGEKGYRRADEVTEDDVRDNMIAWTMRGGGLAA